MRTSPTELQALDYFDQFIADPGKFERSLLDVHLIYADIALRNGHRATAVSHLNAWKRVAASFNTTLSDVLCLTSTASLAFDGALAPTRKEAGDRRASIDAMLNALDERLRSPARILPADRIEVPIFYSTFALEPAGDDIGEAEWEANPLNGIVSASPAPGIPYPRLVYIGVGDGKAAVTYEMADAMPRFGDAQHVIGFPFCVSPNANAGAKSGRIGTVFPKSLTSSKADVGFDIAPGEYDVIARMTAAPDDDTYMWNWDIRLTFIPRGVGRHGILKLTTMS